MSIFDDRLIKLVFYYKGIKAEFDGGLDIRAAGMKYANAIQNECQIRIANLQKDTRDNLATQLTPWNLDQERKSVEVYAGRKSTGYFLLYKGDITECMVTQPPDIYLNIKSKSMQFYKLDYLAQAQSISAPLSQISGGIGESLGVPVRFEATDQDISNWSFSGAVAKQINKMNDLGTIDVYEDNGTLVVKDRGQALKNVTHVLSEESGMIGTPQLTEYGVRVRMLLSPGVTLGGTLTLDSKLNKLLNGDYVIYKMGFDIASRDVPFYGIIEASKYANILTYANMPM